MLRDLGSLKQVKIENSGGNVINPATNEKLEELKALLQAIDNNTDELELKADTINLNTDTLEAKLQSIRDQIDVVLSSRASESTLQQVSDRIGQESGETLSGWLRNIWNKLVELFVTPGTAKVKLHDGTNEITTTTDNGKTRLDVDANISFRDESLITMGHWLRKTYDGYVFHVSNIFTAQSGEDTYILIKNPSGWKTFIRWQLSSELGIKFYFFETPNVTDNGTLCSVRNLNRTYSDTSNALVYHDTTISDEGTLIISQLLAGSNQSSSAGVSDLSIILKENTDYLIKIESLGNGNDIGYEINWFEEEIT